MALYLHYETVNLLAVWAYYIEETETNVLLSLQTIVSHIKILLKNPEYIRLNNI